MRECGILDLSVGEIMARWPETVRIFIDRRMHCIGCPIALFHTLAEAADEHGVPLDDLTEEIIAAVSALGPGR